MILITGANRGVGAALLAHYKAAGVRAQGTARSPGDALLPLDVTDPASVRALAGLVEHPLDLLVCNAGLNLRGKTALDTGYPAADWAATFATNVTGVFLTVQALLPRLRAARGKVAIIGSQMGAASKATGGALIYRASKAAALNLGLNLAAELKPEGIAVGIWHPGWVRTDMGGLGAEIDTGTAVRGLAARFDALSTDTTGVFEAWDGTPMPF
jgi:NAD(P)-dependent dehydrogenase (short-subunit alcohol dehydrogenase family)